MKIFEAIEDECDIDAVLKILKRSPRQVHARSAGKLQPLHLAAWQDCPRIINLLLAHGAKIHARDDQGWTPMHYAAHFDSADAIKILVKVGANLDAKDKGGRRPIQVTTTTEVRRLLRRLGAKIDPETALFLSPRTALSKFIRSAAKSRKNPIALDRLLEFAIGSENAAAVKRLLAKGANPNADFAGRTPLILAVSSTHGNPEILKALIQYGADVNAEYCAARDLPIVTAMSRAKDVFFTDAVEILRRAGARE